jgi:hypothetical protein
LPWPAQGELYIGPLIAKSGWPGKSTASEPLQLGALQLALPLNGAGGFTAALVRSSLNVNWPEVPLTAASRRAVTVAPLAGHGLRVEGGGEARRRALVGLEGGEAGQGCTAIDFGLRALHNVIAFPK